MNDRKPAEIALYQCGGRQEGQDQQAVPEGEENGYKDQEEGVHHSEADPEGNQRMSVVI